MGAEFNFKTLKATTEKEALQEARELIKQAEYDYGHAGYSGSFAECTGVNVERSKFKTLDEAENFITEKDAPRHPVFIGWRAKEDA